MDFQKLAFMRSWVSPYVVWLEARGLGKTTKMAIFLMTKLLLIPDYNWYVFANSQQQSIESFLKLENIAMQRIPSFKTCTEIFQHEVYKGKNSETGFIHDPAGYRFRLFNNSGLTTLSSNLTTIRGKRGSVAYDEASWNTAESVSVVDNFANVDSNFMLGTEKVSYYEPEQMPLQLLYASSAGDVTYPFYERYRDYSKKMFLGDKNYYVCDFDVDVARYHSTVDGNPIKSHITDETIKKQMEDDPDLAERELFNKFRKGAGKNAVVRMETIIANSTVRIPEFFNATGKDKYIFCYDPARNFDGSILSIFKMIKDAEVGYRLELVNCVSMVDRESSKKTPLPMNEQLTIIKKLLIAYNGDGNPEWENVHLFIDSGSGGGGVSAVADQLMADWDLEDGKKHRGFLDRNHKQYQTSKPKYPNASENITLVDPKAYKVLMFDALEKMTKLNLINFPEYDGKDYLLLISRDKNSEEETVTEYRLSTEEQVALLQCNLMKNETIYMCRYETAGGGVSYDLDRDKRNKLHDDRSYTLAMAAYALATKRRGDLTTTKVDNSTPPPLCATAISFD